MTVEWSVFKIKPEDPLVLSIAVKKLLENLRNPINVEIPKEQWDKLSSAAKEMVRNKQVTWITTS